MPRMFLNIITITLIFIFTVSSDKEYQLWDVKLDPLQLYTEEGWRTICYEGIDIDVAHVVCRQNGNICATTIKKSSSSVSGRVITHVLCPSTSNYSLYGETNIMRCNRSDPVLNKPGTCTPAKIFCNTKRSKDYPYKGQVYLDKTKTATPADGVVKVYLDNEWYPVCKNTVFTDTVADSICRQYGYTGSQNNWPSESSGSSKKCVIATEYACTSETGSFECFTHCMIPSKYKIDSYENHVGLICSFDIYAKYITSGSRSRCALDEGSHCSVDDCSHFKSSRQTYRIITGLTGALSSLLLFIVLIVAFWFCRKKKFFGCCGKDYRDLDRDRYQVDGRRNDQ